MSLTKNYEQLTISQDETNQIEETINNEEEELIVVHIAGAVNKEGIIRIKEGARIADIIESAGGLTQEADITNINLAYIVEDGQKIKIPNKQEVQEEKISEEETGKESLIENNETIEVNTKININKAEQTELEQLPGVGPSTAIKIIEYRKENGKFQSIEEIKNVPGIGESKFNTMKEFITIK